MAKYEISANGNTWTTDGIDAEDPSLIEFLDLYLDELGWKTVAIADDDVTLVFRMRKDRFVAQGHSVFDTLIDRDRSFHYDELGRVDHKAAIAYAAMLNDMDADGDSS